MRFVIIIVMLLQGCSTTWTQMGGHNKIDDGNYRSLCHPEKGLSPIYSGTKFNSLCIYENWDNVLLFCVIDIPLSLVADTAILPYTVFSELSGIGYCSEPPEI